MKINMTLRGSAVPEGVTASIVVTFIYPGNVSYSPCDSVVQGSDEQGKESWWEYRISHKESFH